MSKYIIFLLISVSSLWFGLQNDIQLSGNESVQGIIEKLGDEPSPNYPNKLLPGASAEIGESIVKEGLSRNLGGGFTFRQSKYFVCTSCHNIDQESAYLNIVDPQERLEYSAEKGLPFLQGSPLFGIVNRTSFYNDDYEKKYGDLVFKARHDIREAIQLCATECSQGRSLKDWELESVLMYLWTIDLKIDNLVFNGDELNLIENALNDGLERSKALEVIKSKYLDHSPAHLVDPPVDRKNGVEGITGIPENGKLIYENSCLYCHQTHDYSFYKLDNDVLTFKQLKNRMKFYDSRSFYQVVRYGTQPMAGKKAYMPHYTQEKMSIQQLEDLRSYIVSQAKG